MERENTLSSFASLLAQRKPIKVKSPVEHRAKVGELAELIGANDKRALGKMLKRIKGKDIYAVISEVRSEIARGKTAVHAFNLTTYVKK
jgi:hypothetical protein